MASFIEKAALPMLLLLFTMTMSGEGRGRRHVQITNNLDPYYEITLHCRSKNDDFGVKHLGRNDTFAFTFRPALWPVQTLFYCGFQWEKGLHYFNVYEDIRDRDVCGNCWWSVREYGHICRFNFNTKQYDDCFAWK
ncbi:hypothetical protein ACLB2K_035604 [Fragaria x ananassa]